MSDIENILKQLKDNYLDELPEKLQSIESIILNLNKYKNIDDFHELYRHIHSQKGTAGTHGLTFLSAICHQLEDEFMDIGDNISSITDAHTKNWLEYMDLFTEVSEFYRLGHTDTSKFENKLKTLIKTISKSTYSCLLVDTKSATLNIITEVLKQHSIHTTIFEDGYEALGRLLVNKYDMLICGLKVSSLSGIGLITAIKTSESINQKIPSVLITSTSFDRTVRANDPDYIIKKDTGLPRTLDEACKDIKNNLK